MRASPLIIAAVAVYITSLAPAAAYVVVKGGVHSGRHHAWLRSHPSAHWGVGAVGAPFEGEMVSLPSPPLQAPQSVRDIVAVRVLEARYGLAAIANEPGFIRRTQFAPIDALDAALPPSAGTYVMRAKY